MKIGCCPSCDPIGTPMKKIPKDRSCLLLRVVRNETIDMHSKVTFHTFSTCLRLTRSTPKATAVYRGHPVLETIETSQLRWIWSCVETTRSWGNAVLKQIMLSQLPSE